jgi:hypothetical protein
VETASPQKAHSLCNGTPTRNRGTAAGKTPHVYAPQGRRCRPLPTTQHARNPARISHAAGLFSQKPFKIFKDGAAVPPPAHHATRDSRCPDCVQWGVIIPNYLYLLGFIIKKIFKVKTPPKKILKKILFFACF